jgi:hypothetical protein
LTALEYGNPSTNLYAVTDVSSAWIENSQILFPYAQMGSLFTSQGPLQFGTAYNSGIPVYLKYTYVNGFANDLIATAVATQSTLTVTNGVGITAGLNLRIYDGINTENVTVASTYTFGSTTVPLISPLVYSHDAGVSISALPPAIKEATILATTAMLKVRGDSSLTMSVGTLPNSGSTGNLEQNIGSDMAMAMDLLKPYRRIR